MKNQILALTFGVLSLATYAQKDELKAAEKAIKKGELKEAQAIIESLEGSEDSMDPKYKGKYLYLKGVSYGKSNVEKAADAYNALVAFEKAEGKQKYTKEAQPKLAELVQTVSNKAIEQYNNKDYKNAKGNFALTYKLSPADTTFLYNAAVSASLDEDYDSALNYYKELLDVGYTGITTQYIAVNKETGQEEDLGTKSNRDNMIKFGKYTTPSDKVSPSRKGDIIKNMGYIYVNQGKPELAIKALEEARKNDPKDINLLLNQAQMYIQLEKMDKFGELMEEAVELDPTNPSLFFNLGVVNANEGKSEEAISFYKKAIELKPDYADAYMNLAISILSEEKAIVDEMNQNLSNNKKYTELEAKQKEVYRKALPYLEKADSLSRSLDTVRTLLNLYDTLEMEEKADALRPIFKEMRDQ
ncbi:tetratricopeptide repeat protein [Polaribacter sargassicola]|uniref:tetratricopeptide repeat protein n=1 Tax=Polaribacter sargassicola TaxID=2836891 RepID=UPI001F3DAD2A|nr:tetratricopeptide repeat protein [Polaribacter sp. DS7-9]MCG1036519.1 tetratricopeptide repeat protein [Polaribacter sp. DS7-9]